MKVVKGLGIVALLAVIGGCTEAEQPATDKGAENTGTAAPAGTQAQTESSGDNWDKAKKESAEAWEETKEASGEVWEATKQTSSEAWEKTKEVGNQISEDASKSWDETKVESKENWEEIKQTSSDAWEATKEKGAEMMGSDSAPADTAAETAPAATESQ